MNPTLVTATMADYPVMQNMGRFYVYEMSRYCGWECPEDGVYDCLDFKHHFEQPNNYPFMIKVGKELAGFLIVDKKGTNENIDWNMAKFQKHGFGKKIAHQVFNQFNNLWEVTVMPENLGALHFWRKVIGSYTKGQFEESLQTVPEPEPHPMIVLTFRSTP